MKKEYDLEEVIAQDIALHMLGAMLSDAMHTFKLESKLLLKDEKNDFIEKSLELAKRTDMFNPHFGGRIIELGERVKQATAILLVGLKKFASPEDINCGLCGFKECSDYQSFFKENNKGRKAICTVEYMSFSSAVSKGIQIATQFSIACMLARSLGIAAQMQNLIDADFAMGILIEVGQGVKTMKANKMEIKLKRED